MLYLSQKHKQKLNPTLSKLNFTKKAKYLQRQATVKQTAGLKLIETNLFNVFGEIFILVP